MKKQYLVQVENKNNIEFLKNFGSIIHVAKLRSLVIFEAEEQNAEKLSEHPHVRNIKPSRTFELA